MRLTWYHEPFAPDCDAADVPGGSYTVTRLGPRRWCARFNGIEIDAEYHDRKTAFAACQRHHDRPILTAVKDAIDADDLAALVQGAQRRVALLKDTNKGCFLTGCGVKPAGHGTYNPAAFITNEDGKVVSFVLPLALGRQQAEMKAHQMYDLLIARVISAMGSNGYTVDKETP